MKRFGKLFLIAVTVIAIVFGITNYLLYKAGKISGREYRVEAERLAFDMENGKNPDLSACSYVTGVVKYEGQKDFYDGDSDYLIKEIGGDIYRFDYASNNKTINSIKVIVNISLAVMSVFVLLILVYVGRKVLKPFNALSSVPYELSKGKLTSPLQESRNRYFGKFVWGVNMLRENILDQKENELRLLKDKQTLILSISHDIKTPLSAIKLYSKAMERGLYSDHDKILEVAANIDRNAGDIEKYVNELTKSASEDFMEMTVEVSEEYLSKLIEEICIHYSPKFQNLHTDFKVEPYDDCLLKCDATRSLEVIKNLMDNAIKYGDGKHVRLSVCEEDGCKLLTVANSGCSLPVGEMVHVFESFYRGSNAGNKPGSGLGLYICRQLMLKMGGDIFAEQKDGEMRITAVFPKA